jgi:hypothetical protein
MFEDTLVIAIRMQGLHAKVIVNLWLGRSDFHFVKAHAYNYVERTTMTMTMTTLDQSSISFDQI